MMPVTWDEVLMELLQLAGIAHGPSTTTLPKTEAVDSDLKEFALMKERGERLHIMLKSCRFTFRSTNLSYTS
jgi:hypothetical protein